MIGFYGNAVDEETRKQLEIAVKALPVEVFSLRQELMLTRMAAAPNVKKWNEERDAEDVDERQKMASALMMMHSLKDVKDFAESAARVERIARDDMTQDLALMLLDNIVALVYECFESIVPITAITDFEEKVRDVIRLGSQQGTELLPEEIDETVLAMDGTVPRLDTQDDTTLESE